MKSENAFDVIVIGGGASGMMAACIAASAGKRVCVLEKNRVLGEKLRISGGGRCNITNATFDVHAMLANYGDAAKFLFSPFVQFGVQDTIDFFEERGLPLITQERNRMFPETQRAVDVAECMITEMKRLNVIVRTGAPVTAIQKEGDRITSVSVSASNEQYVADQYILATGGLSHPETGSTGDGFKWLKDLGHTIAKPTPTIVPLAASEDWIKELSGTTLENVKITFYADGVRAFQTKGNILCTHFGISGPTILNSAAKVSRLLENAEVTAAIDLFPGEDEGALDKRLITILEEQKNKEIQNALKGFVPGKLVDSILFLLDPNIKPSTPVHSFKKEQRKALVKLVKALHITIPHLMGFDRAVVADGGLPLTEIDPKTMRSKKIDNLSVTGDLLHINRPSGGYSLQLCWTTGFVAGAHV